MWQLHRMCVSIVYQLTCVCLGIGRRADAKEAVFEIDIASEFDNFVRESFDIEPPLGKSRAVDTCVSILQCAAHAHWSAAVYVRSMVCAVCVQVSACRRRIAASTATSSTWTRATSCRGTRSSRPPKRSSKRARSAASVRPRATGVTS